MKTNKMLFTAKKMIKRSFQKAWFARLIAKSIDLFIVLVLSLVYFSIGFFLAIVYLALADSLGNGQSLGKRVMGMRTIDIETCEKCQWKQSVVRNLPLCAPYILIIIPIIGWIVGGFLLFVFVGIEIYLFTTLKSHQRLGDMMAETTVIVSGEKPESIAKNISWFKEIRINSNPCEN